MSATAEQILSDLKQKKFAPVYFLQGEEPYFIDQVADLIESTALTPSERSFNQTICYGKESEVNKILANARKFPMMAERNVVIVKEAQEIPDLEKENGTKQLLAYLEKPVPSTVLVFCYKHKKLDKRKSLASVLEKKTVFLSSEKVKEYKLAEWIEGFCKQKSIKIAPQAAALIAEYLGNDLGRIANELDKVVINLKDGQTIDENIVQKYIGISKDYNLFELQKAIGDKQIEKIYQIIFYFESNPKSVATIQLISSLYGYFTKVFMLHAIGQADDKTIAATLGISPYGIKDYKSAARNFPPQKMGQIFDALKTADLHSKGIEVSSVSDGEIMKELMFKIVH